MTRTSHRRWWLAALAFVGLLGACGSAPPDRLEEARAAVLDKDTAKFATYFTRNSQLFLIQMLRNAERSKIHYAKNAFDFLPEGDVEDVTVDGNAAFLKIKNKRGTEEIRMVQEGGEWCIDLFALERFWKPLQGGQL